MFFILPFKFFIQLFQPEMYFRYFIRFFGLFIEITIYIFNYSGISHIHMKQLIVYIKHI